MKLGMSHYGHKSIPDAKFESDSSSSFGNMTSQNSEEGNESSNSAIYPPENGFNLKKNEFLCPESFFSTQNFQVEEKFFIL